MSKELNVTNDLASLEKKYLDILPRYERLCEETKRIISSSFIEIDIPYHNIDSRAKNLNSFIRKAKRTNDSGDLKYENPLAQITDISGVRIITYTLRDVESVCNFISDNFDIIEKRNVGEERFKDGKFGYQSYHFLIKYNKSRTSLPDFSVFIDLVCEIQVRTVLQHAWAEIEHDIQYKNQSGLPRTLQRKFIALAGLLEIADREFQTIQDEDNKLKRIISESLQEDLTRQTLASKSDIIISNKESSIKSEDTSVRLLIRLGKYKEAIKKYDSLIDITPTMYTLYVGRAKAKFLSGDRNAAMLDIDQALKLNSEDDSVLRLKEQIIEGEIESVRPSSIDSNEYTKKGHEFLTSGDGVAAFEMYSIAQEKGASKPFSIINKAMACLLAEDFEGAKYLLSNLEIRDGVPMGVNIIAIYCIMYALTDNDKFATELQKLEKCLKGIEDFSISMSPLSKLKAGIKSDKKLRDDNKTKMIDGVFSTIEN